MHTILYYARHIIAAPASGTAFGLGVLFGYLLLSLPQWKGAGREHKERDW